MEYSSFNCRFENGINEYLEIHFSYACYYIYRRIYEDDFKYFQNPNKVVEFMCYKKGRKIRSFSKFSIENRPIAMCTSQTDHRAMRDVYARLYRHFGVPFRSARFHKFFGHHEVMLALARSSAHHGDSKAMKILFDYFLQEGSNLLSLEDFMSILNEKNVVKSLLIEVTISKRLFVVMLENGTFSEFGVPHGTRHTLELFSFEKLKIYM